MSSQRSVGKFCSVVVSNLITGGTDSIAGLDATSLGDGAEAYCTSTQTAYRLHLFGGNTNLQPAYVPALGGGSWQSQDSSDYGTSLIGTSGMAAVTTAVTLNTWHAMPSAVGAYNPVLSSTLWSIDTTAGTLTYDGPLTKKYLFVASFNASSSETARPWALQFFLNTSSLNLIGSTASTPFATKGTATQSDGGFGGASIFCSTSIAISVSSASVYQMAFRLITSGVSTGIVMDAFQLNVIAI